MYYHLIMIIIIIIIITIIIFVVIISLSSFCDACTDTFSRVRICRECFETAAQSVLFWASPPDHGMCVSVELLFVRALFVCPHQRRHLRKLRSFSVFGVSIILPPREQPAGRPLLRRAFCFVLGARAAGELSMIMRVTSLSVWNFTLHHVWGWNWFLKIIWKSQPRTCLGSLTSLWLVLFAVVVHLVHFHLVVSK